jgi:hypothetical protein
MNPHSKTIWASAQNMADGFLARLPSLVVAATVFLIFYFTSALLSRIIRRATQDHRRNLGVVFARLASAAVVLLGVLVAFSIVAPSFQAADLIKVLGIGSVAIGFAFQNILQNFLAGLLLLWAEPFLQSSRETASQIPVEPVSASPGLWLSKKRRSVQQTPGGQGLRSRRRRHRFPRLFFLETIREARRAPTKDS